MRDPLTVTYGCSNPECGYAIAPTTIVPQTTYTTCPLCRAAPFIANPPPADKRDRLKGKTK